MLSINQHLTTGVMSTSQVNVLPEQEQVCNSALNSFLRKWYQFLWFAGGTYGLPP